jgi:hypothetical protein
MGTGGSRSRKQPVIRSSARQGSVAPALAEIKLYIEHMANDADPYRFGNSQKADPKSSLPADVDDFPLDGGGA